MTDFELAVLSRLDRIEFLLAGLIDPDAARLESMLPAIWIVTEGMRFAVADLQGEINFHGLTLPQIGKLLARNQYRAIGGYAIARAGRGGWQVTPQDGPPARGQNVLHLKRKG